MTAPAKPQAVPGSVSNLVASVFGVILGLMVVKLGNPVIFSSQIETPQNAAEFIFLTWPMKWGFFLLLPLVLAGFLVFRWEKPRPGWLFLLPALWFLWQYPSAAFTTDKQLTRSVLLHFDACLFCFYLGALALCRCRNLTWFWAGLMLGFLYVLWDGWDQHFGGLEETRRQVQNLDLSRLSPEMRLRLNTPEFQYRLQRDRVFSTFVYPNTFAQGILLLLPPLLYAAWHWGKKRGAHLAGLLAGLLAALALACLFWTGSKAGWLIALVLIVVALLRLNFSRALKMGLAGILIVGGLTGFFLKHAGYFEKGATSVSARLDYWRAAARITREHPLLGSGPGTFGVQYRQIKDPKAEMARLTHNDYLEQASDAGLPAFLAYAAFWIGGLVYLGRKSWARPELFAVWLGLLGFSLQSLSEFGLYVPALAWPAFLLIGWLGAASQETTG